jgi:hypothetical protein
MAHSITPTRYRPSRRPTPEADGARRAPRTARPEGLEAAPADRFRLARRLSAASAALIVVGGYVHFCLYRHGYRFIPKIGVSFLLQFSASAVLAGALLIRGGHVRLGRHRVALPQLVRLAAIGFSVGDLAALGIAHTPGGLFQFREIGLQPAPQTLVTIAVESLTAVLLVVAMLQARRAESRGSTVKGRGVARAGGHRRMADAA